MNLGLKYEPYGKNGFWYEFKLKIARKLVFSKWKEALGQSLHYAESTNKKAAILLIKRQNSKKDYYSELVRVINKFKLPIKVFLVGEEI